MPLRLNTPPRGLAPPPPGRRVPVPRLPLAAWLGTERTYEACVSEERQEGNNKRAVYKISPDNLVHAWSSFSFPVSILHEVEVEVGTNACIK